MMGAHRVFLSIGSNMGNKQENCQRALAEIENRCVGRILAQSPLYRTEPVDYLDQDWFVNGAVAIETDLSPHALMTALQAIQADLGTVTKDVRFGPRVIDLDILLYDETMIQTTDLVVPHERMQDRAFVLVPLNDIAEDVMHPVLNKTVGELLARLNTERQGVLPL